MAKKVVKKGKSSDESKLFAFLTAFLGLIGFIIAMIAKRQDKYVMFYAKQTLVIVIISFGVGIISIGMVFIPFLGWALMSLLNLGVVALWAINWISALSGKEKEIPIIGKWARKINL